MSSKCRRSCHMHAIMLSKCCQCSCIRYVALSYSIDCQLCDGVNVLRVVFVTYMTSCCGDVFSVLSHIAHVVIIVLKRLSHMVWMYLNS